MNQRDTRERSDTIPVSLGGKKTTCTEILKSPSDGLKNIVNIWIRSCQLIFSHIASRKERERYENNFSFGVNGQGPKPGPKKKRANFAQTMNKLLVLKQQVENPNQYIPGH